ncbi:MAG: hypothetical protein Q9219_003402 [cf. Caloplaca sp. 3 TL-2023]
MEKVTPLPRRLPGTRKYRDEPRPRQGLLRTREFLMKDLYTFDATPEQALGTYGAVRNAYDSIFNELHIRFVVARAASGDIGGNLSHEYHIPTASGEDTFIQCGVCTYAVNEEWVPDRATDEEVQRTAEDWGPYQSWFGISSDRCHLVEAVLPQEIRVAGKPGPELRKGQINPHFIKALYPDLDLGIERPLEQFLEYWKDQRRVNPSTKMKMPLPPRTTQIYDYRIPQRIIDRHSSVRLEGLAETELAGIVLSRIQVDRRSLDLARVHDGSKCPKCGEPSLRVLRTLELGHTFHLGQRYSKTMNTTFATAPKTQHDDEALTEQAQDGSAPNKQGQDWFHMGCHGIGISRMIAAVADSLADEKGLIWPWVMAPYQAVILATEEHKVAANEVWDLLTQQTEGSDPVEAALDDRDKSFGWKLKDADLLGFPVVIILGSNFEKWGLCEVSIRRLGLRQRVIIKDLRGYIASTLAEI